MSFPDHVATEVREAILSLLERHYADAQAVLLYGSTLSGTRHPESDIDLFVVLSAGDRPHERSVLHRGLRFQITAVPHAALGDLAKASRRAKRPIGIIGLARGALVTGVLPDLNALRSEAANVLAEINRTSIRQAGHTARIAVDVANQALSAGGEHRGALVLRAVPMLLEAELHAIAQEYHFKLSRYRDLAGDYPDLVASYIECAKAALAGDLEPLRQTTERLRMSLPARPDDIVLRDVPIEALRVRD